MNRWGTKQFATCLFFLSLIGVAVSVYSAAHYFGITSGGWCNVSDVLSCDIVNKSAYAQIGGIPVSVIGLIGYLLLAIASYLKWQEQTIDRGLTQFLIMGTFSGLLFSLYLTSIEAFILHAFCPTCLLSQATILLMSVFILLLYVRERHL